MKPKNFILLFIFGLFLFLLPSVVEAACPLSCEDSGTNCFWGPPYSWSPPNPNQRPGVERVGTIQDIGKTDYLDGTSYCSRSNGKCQESTFPTGNNGQVCVAHDEAWDWGACNDCSKAGNWDYSESQCIQCNGKVESKYLGNTSTIYDNPCVDPPAGDGLCESACGADTYMDEFPPSSCSTIQCGYGNTKRLDCADANCNPSDGVCESTCGADSACDGLLPDASCGTGTKCNSDCQCVSTCVCTSTTTGGCCDGCNYCPSGTVYNGASCVDSTSTLFCEADGTNGNCTFTARECGTGGTCDGGSGGNTVNVTAGKVYTGGSNCTSNCYGDSTQTVYCGVSCTGGAYSGCTFKALECKAGGVCDNTNTYYTTQNIPINKVCTSNALGDPSVTNYCDYNENCDAGDCLASQYYRSCYGTGSCRTSNTNAYVVDVYASASYSLTSTCGVTGSTLCGSSYLASSGPGNNHYGDGGSDSCQGMCDGSGNCDYAVNCVGCSCGAWSNAGCGVSPCSSTQMKQTRTCTPASCDITSQCVADASCTGAFDFSISIDPTSGSVNQGQSASTQVTASTTSGTPETVYFSASGLHSTMTYSFSTSNNCLPSPNCLRTMTVNTSASTPTGIYNITVCGTNSGGTVTKCYYYYQLTVNPAAQGITPPQVTTNDATNITSTSATLNGTLTNMGGAASCLVWFEYKKSTDTIWTKVCETTMTTGSFSCNLTGLTSNTNYDFEAFAKNGGSW